LEIYRWSSLILVDAIGKPNSVNLNKNIKILFQIYK